MRELYRKAAVKPTELYFSPVGDLFRQRARKFPGIINCTTIDWFHEWPKDALVSVALRFLEDVETGGRSEIRDNVAYHIAEVHISVGAASQKYLKAERRYNYTTPKSFLRFSSNCWLPEARKCVPTSSDWTLVYLH